MNIIVHTCDVCGMSVAGEDLVLQETDLVVCVNIHTFCEEHLIKPLSEISKILREDIEDTRFCIPDNYCPICTFQKLVDREAIAYLYKKLGITEEELIFELQMKYDDYDSFYSEILMNLNFKNEPL